MKTDKILLWFFLLTALIISCQKERSFENGKGSPSDGSLQSGVTGDCLGSVVSGTYKKDTVLNSTNYVDVKVDVNIGGSYVISSDTINGFFFRATGTFSATGVNTVRLQGNGKPLAGGTNIFTVTYDSTQCTFPVTTLGSGGTSVFTLAGAPSDCTPGTTQGTYSVGTPTTALNTATIQVNVTTVGTYSIATSAVNGVTFSVSGTFASTGIQTVTLTANGTPAATGSFPVPVTAGSSTCSFTFTVTAPDYYPRTTNSNWSYNLFDDVSQYDTLFRQVIAQTKSALGNTYNIFMETTDASAGFDSSGYFRRSGGDYYQYFDFGNFFGLDNEVWGEYIFLKDNVATGTIWRSSAFNGSFTYTDSTGLHTVPISVRVKETIQQKDVSVTVNSITSPFTIVVKEEYEYSFDGGANWILSDAFYSIYNYGRNIGLLKWDGFDSTGKLLGEQEITRADVK
jgi:hypothetical protein